MAEQKKKGGNGDVDIKGGIAKKTLRNTSTKDKRRRFIKEIEILQSLEKEGVDNVVQILEYNLEDDRPWYSMRAYSGDADGIVDLLPGDVRTSAKLLLPIAETLMRLSQLKVPIFHRDLKPENLLVCRTDTETKLMLADFGCAYFPSDEKRLTPDFWAIGATNYRAPEYHHSRVEEVTEKGDIFSLAKIFWFLINGVRGDFFPYTLWFPELYNLAHRFPGAPGIAKANLLIAAATHHDPARRLGYGAFIEQLRDMAEGNLMTGNEDEEFEVAALVHDQEMVLQSEEQRAIVSNILAQFESDLAASLATLPNVEAVAGMREAKMFPIQQTVEEVVDRSSNHPVWGYDGRRLHINTRIYPISDWFVAVAIEPRNDNPFLHFKISAQNRDNNPKEFTLIYYLDRDSGLSVFVDGQSVPHQPEHLHGLLRSAIQYISVRPTK